MVWEKNERSQSFPVYVVVELLNTFQWRHLFTNYCCITFFRANVSNSHPNEFKITDDEELEELFIKD